MPCVRDDNRLGTCAVALGAAMALLVAFYAYGVDENSAPLTMARNTPLVQVQVNESGSYLFLLDTCLRLPVLDAAIVAQIGLPVFADDGSAATGASPDSRRTTTATLSVAGIATQDATCVVADLSPLQQRLGAPVAGLLPAHQPGYELVLDFPMRTAAWLPLDKADLTRQGDGVLPVTFDESGAPRVKGIIDGVHEAPLRLDTALREVIALGEGLVPAQQASGEARPKLETMLDVAGERVATHVRLDALAVGDAKFISPVCICLPGDAARLGMDFLKHFRVTLNYEHGLLRLQRAGGMELSDPPMTGFGLALGGLVEGLWWLHVAAHSPASAAGVRTGDRLLAVDGVSAAHVPAETLEAYLRGDAGQEREFMIDRSGQAVNVRLAAVRLL